MCYGRTPKAGKLSLKEDVLTEAAHWMEIRPELKPVFIADGSPDNWRYCEEAYPHATQILEISHTLQHLSEALDVACGEGSLQARLRFEILHQILKDAPDGIDRVIRALRYLSRKHPRRKVISRVLAFFRKQRHRMHYAEFRARRMQIGSGPVEAANKTLFKVRMKASGMRWSEHGTGQQILTFRAL